MKPMLAHTYEPKRWNGGLCHVQPKLNGVRALYQAGTFQSREELPWNPNVLAHLTKDLRAIFPEPELILDGELYVHGWNLQRINGAVQIARTEPREDTKEVEYWIFDRVSYQLGFKERFKLVEDRSELFVESKIRLVVTINATRMGYGYISWAGNDCNTIDEFYAACVAQGYEGMMYRLGDCPYTRPKEPFRGFEKYLFGSAMKLKFMSDKNNRVWHLLKRKDWQDGEFECVAVKEGVGKRAGMVGAFVCRTSPMGERTFDVGSGLTDAEALHYWNEPPLKRKIKVKYLTLTTDGKPFNPTVEAIL